jgi:hypothetical protein
MMRQPPSSGLRLLWVRLTRADLAPEDPNGTTDVPDATAVSMQAWLENDGAVRG